MHDLLTKDTSTQGVGLCGFKISRLQTFFHLRKDRFHVLYRIKELLKKQHQHLRTVLGRCCQVEISPLCMCKVDFSP